MKKYIIYRAFNLKCPIFIIIIFTTSVTQLRLPNLEALFPLAWSHKITVLSVEAVAKMLS